MAVTKRVEKPIKKRPVRESTKEIDNIEVNTDKYVKVHGREPRGTYGMWMFKIDGDEVAFSGTYSKARELAVEYAKKVHATVVYVLG